MKDLVSDRRTRAAGMLGVAVIVAAALVGPGDAWMGSMSHVALAVLLMTTTVVCLGRLGPATALARVAVKP
jgi:hypothetical protein